MKKKVPDGLSERLIELRVPENKHTRELVGMFLHGGYYLVIRDEPEREMLLVPKIPVDESPQS